MKYTNRVRIQKISALALASLVIAGLAGCGGNSDNSSSSSSSTSSSNAMGPGSSMAMGPSMAGFGAGGGTSASAGASAGTPSKVTPENLHYTQDPFYVSWKRKPLPPDPFEEVQPLQVASTNAAAPPAKPITVRQVPDRRVAGILSGQGVYAILEQNGTSEIVKPGGVTSDGYTVVDISPTGVKLRKREGNIILTQNVPLTDQQTSTQAAGFAPGGFGPGAAAGGGVTGGNGANGAQ